MRQPPSKDRDPRASEGPNDIADQSERRPQVTTRLAEDGVEQIAETLVWLDTLDVVMLEALAGGGNYTLVDACEYVLVGHGRIRRHLGAALVAVG